MSQPILMPIGRPRPSTILPLALISLLAFLVAGGANPFVHHAAGGIESEAARANLGTDGVRENRTTNPWARVFTSFPPTQAARPQLSRYPIEVNGEVTRFVERFQTGVWREMMSRWLDRSTRYLGMIRRVLRSKGLPEELAFTAMIESGFKPRAVSPAGAKGLWQFMERTGRRYGLRVDRWVDERMDPEKSTEAAARYLNDLFAQFGDWPLAQAAYNGGAVTIERAVRRSRSNDFWTLARGRWLRKETRRFVPQIQAGILIARDPERYGFRVTPEDPMAYEVVQVPFVVRIKGLAALTGLRYEILRDLNAELRRGVTPPGEGYGLKVPPGSASAVGEALERLRARRAQATRHSTNTRVHVVKPRDTLYGIAKRYGVTVSELIRLNGLDRADLIHPGDQIRLSAALRSERRSVR